MKIKTMMAVAAATICLTNLANAGSFDIGARYGRTIEESGNTVEVAARYLPIPFVSAGVSLGYADLKYDKKIYYKKVESMPLGGYLNAHLPIIPFVKPYAGIGGIYYINNSVTSPNPSDRGKEYSGTMTFQGGVDISIPVPFLSLNLEARRLVNDRQTQLLGGVWFRF